jgi:hypothetical protein
MQNIADAFKKCTFANKTTGRLIDYEAWIVMTDLYIMLEKRNVSLEIGTICVGSSDGIWDLSQWSPGLLCHKGVYCTLLVVYRKLGSIRETLR